MPDRDLVHVLEHTSGQWEDMRGGRLFVTGGTGFFGRWMLESFLRANDELSLGAAATVLTRDPGQFARALPTVAGHAAVTLHPGDVRTFEFPRTEPTHVLHMATESGPTFSPPASLETAVAGTKQVLAFAAATGAQKLLLTSSGAVYGPQPPDRDRLAEDDPSALDPDDAAAGYGNGKRAAESLCVRAAAETRLEAKIARCFAFVGPQLPLNANFAIGNFIRDALYGDRIAIKGDGTARRSYLYAADLAVWLWTILFQGEAARPYNVGSQADLSISELALLVRRLLRPGIPTEIAVAPTSGVLPARYVPSTERAERELELHCRVNLDESVLRTAEWDLAGPTP